MAKGSGDEKAPIIVIKKVIKGGGGHHGRAVAVNVDPLEAGARQKVDLGHDEVAERVGPARARRCVSGG